MAQILCRLFNNSEFKRRRPPGDSARASKGTNIVMDIKKVSEWLNEIGTHSILICAESKEDFFRETEEVAPWNDGYSRKAMTKQIEDRGKGGSLGGINDGKKLIGALDVAYACYGKWSGDEEAASKYGMGSQFREYVDALKRAGH